MDLLTGIGLALPAGLNAYIPLLGVAMAQRAGWIHLPAPYSVLGEWWAVGLIVILLCVEILADKVPAVDHVNDAINTLVRPASGALLMLATTGQLSARFPIVMIVAGIVLAGGVHAAKAAARPVINVGTAGVGAPIASFVEDVVAVLVTWLAFVAPVLAIAGVVALLAIAARAVMRRRARARALPDQAPAPPP